MENAKNDSKTVELKSTKIAVEEAFEESLEMSASTKIAVEAFEIARTFSRSLQTSALTIESRRAE